MFRDFALGLVLLCYRSDDLARRQGAQVQGDVFASRDFLAQGPTSQSRDTLRSRH